MRTKYTLYVNGQRVDINADALVLMNYKQSDAETPAAVFNSWSQELALPRTSKNNVIFDHIYRADHTTQAGKFNVLQRTPFEIISDTGEKLEAGYLKLIDMNGEQYTVILYGGLGGFLFSLMYNADGSKKSLADLDYTVGGGADELTFSITRDAVREAWRTIAGIQAHADLWNIINFAPCYNGIPGGDFDAGSAFCADSCFGVKNNDGDYYSRNGHVKVDLVNSVDEWAAGDLRSYQQRPVISIKEFFDALQRWASANGYTFNLDASFFNNVNPYYWKSWLTLPKLDGLTLPTESGSGTENVPAPAQGALPAYDSTARKVVDVPGPWDTDKRRTTKYDISVSFLASAGVGGDYEPRVAAWQRNSGGVYTQHRLVTMYQLVAYDADGVIVGGSKIAAATTHVQGSGTPLEDTVSPANFVSKYNLPLGTKYAEYDPEYIDSSIPYADNFDASMYNGEYYGFYDGDVTPKVLKDANDSEITLNLTINGVTDVAAVKLHIAYLAVYTQSGDAARYHQEIITALPYYSDTSNTYPLTDVSIRDGVAAYDYQAGGTVKSGAVITKKLLLGGTHTPADYLLSFAKQFGLSFRFDVASKTVDLMTRNSWYSLDANPVNLQERIDLPSRKVVPYVIRSRWYEWVNAVKGKFADYYKSIYGLEYGMARVNTGFEFDASHTGVLNDSILRGAAEVLHQSKYFETITENSKPCPAPFIDGGSFTLWNYEGETQEQDIVTPSDAATIVYLNSSYKGYDVGGYPKPEFCDKDGKEVEGEDVLLMYDGAGAPTEYGRVCLTDDNGLMTLYNEGKPCWLLGQASIAANAPYVIGAGLNMPRFRRMLTAGTTTATHSLDMAVPSEIDQPAITCAADKAVYQRGWANYTTDKMDVDAKAMTCKVNLRGLQVGQNLLRNFYYFDGCVWVLNQIKNYVVGGDNLTECEFIKVKDKTNYTNGQTY